MDRFVIDAYGVDVAVERQALDWLIREATKRGSQAAIIVPGVNSIESLGRVLGAELAAHGKQHRTIRLNGVTVNLFTPKTQPRSFDGPVLVLWADTRMVEEAERLGPSAICATGWSEDGLDDWKRAWAPTDPRTGEAEAIADQAPAAVRGAVESLSGPLGNDVIHSMDKKRAVNAFKALYELGIPIDSVLVRTLAIQRGWEPDAANRLAEIADKIGRGRTVRGGDRMTQAKTKELVARFE